MKTKRLAFLLLAPAIAIVAFTTIYPMVVSFRTSFHVFNLARSNTLGRFVGLENYTEAFFEDPEFWEVISSTAIFVVADVTLTILCALGLAMLLLRAGFGKTILRTLLILPFAMSPVLIGFSFRFMLNPAYGAFARTLGAIFPFAQDVDYLSNPVRAMGSLVVADVWHWAPYFAFMLMGGLAAIPAETQEAARIDGASEWRTFRDVTLPQLAPVLMVAIILKSVFALKVFDLIVTMTAGGPGRSTTTLAYFAYHIGFRDLQFGYASAVAYILTGVLLLLSLSYFRFAFRRP